MEALGSGTMKVLLGVGLHKDGAWVAAQGTAEVARPPQAAGETASLTPGSARPRGWEQQ